MSSETTPISPARFASALKDLSIASLHLKVLELRNSIAHLDYSNEQLRPFAEGKEATIEASASARQSGGNATEPDQDCIDAIRENETVIARMQERIALIKSEVEERGYSWREFRSQEEIDVEAAQARQSASVNGDDQHVEAAEDIEQSRAPTSQHAAWLDGTIETGVISSNGTVRLNGQPRASGGSLTDEELRRRMEEQMRGLEEEDDPDAGMHL
jgi:hypothetical protein